MIVTYTLDQLDLRKCIEAYFIAEFSAKRVKGLYFHHTEDDRSSGVYYYSADVQVEMADKPGGAA